MVGGFTALLYLIEEIDEILPADLDRLFGIVPRSVSGLDGILFAPLLHDGWWHLHENTLPLLVLGFLVMSGGLRQWVATTATIWLISGLGVWLISPEGSSTVGVSGVVIGWLVFLLARGIFTRSFLQLGAASVLVFYWGSILLLIFPSHPMISWQGHLFGAAAGLLAVWLVAKANWLGRTPTGSPNITGQLTHRDVAAQSSAEEWYAEQAARVLGVFADAAVPAMTSPHPPDDRVLTRRPDDGPVTVPEADQVLAFAQAITQTAWTDVTAELGKDAGEVSDIKTQMANHGWCDLLVGLARVVDTYGQVVDRVPELVTRQVGNAVLNSSMRDMRAQVTSAVVDIVVERVWGAFKGATVGNVPLLSGLTGGDVVRSLRVLAVFVCPAPEEHEEVREYALKPLGDDARRILTEQMKAQLTRLFDKWMTSD